MDEPTDSEGDEPQHEPDYGSHHEQVEEETVPNEEYARFFYADMDTNEQQFSCNICQTRFLRKAALIKHLCHTHQIAPPNRNVLVCSYCSKKFISQYNLTRHLFRHTGQKPYSCKECGRNFAQKWSLRRHEIEHVGEKQFECEQCCKSFFRKEHLKKHLQTLTHQKMLETAAENAFRRPKKSDKVVT